MRIQFYLSILLLTMIFIPAQAQKKTKASPDEQAKLATSKMKLNLNLTDVQEKKVYKIQLDKFTKLNELENNSVLTFREKKKALKEARIEFRKKTNSVLTPEQQQKRKSKSKVKH